MHDTSGMISLGELLSFLTSTTVLFFTVAIFAINPPAVRARFDSRVKLTHMAPQGGALIPLQSVSYCPIAPSGTCEQIKHKKTYLTREVYLDQ